MKKIVFSIVGSMLISLCAVQAQQQDTTGMAKSRNKQNKQRYEQSRQQQDQQRQQSRQAWQQQDDRSDNAYANEGMVIIDKDEIPASLKQTLKKEKYAGWENATIYHNTNTGEYVIAPRAYRFDEQGREMEVAGNTGYGNRDGQNRYSQDQRSGRSEGQAPERTSQTQQGQDARGETSTYSSGNETDRNTQYQDNEASQTKRNQTSKTQPQTYDQATGNQQPPDDESMRDDQNTRDQSSATERTYDQSQEGQRDGQQPSTGYRSGQTDRSTTDDQSGQMLDNQYRTEHMTEVEAAQVPASLRRTLNERQYSGWEENGKLYRDPSTNEYVLVIEKSDDSSQPRAYRFDKNGKLKEDQTGTDQSRSNNGQNGSSQRNNDQ